MQKVKRDASDLWIRERIFKKREKGRGGGFDTFVETKKKLQLKGMK